METKIIDGKAIGDWIKDEVARRFIRIREEKGITPGLAVILAGDDPASAIYVKNKATSCKKIGFLSEVHSYSSATTTEEILAAVDQLNRRSEIHGILVQLPLPPQVDKQRVLEAVEPRKDVDGFHPVNLGRLLRGDHLWTACTPAGIMKLFEYEQIDLVGKEVVVMGRSDIVGKPMAILLMHAHATVTICHSRTRDLAGTARRADILISAMGKPGLVDRTFIKEGAVVIDVGTSRILPDQAWPELLEDGSVWRKSLEKNGYALAGDVRHHQLLGIARAVTPVPGGVGPLTIAMLLHNTLIAAESQVF
jgi:methylenetetrahydrofolate dehydrogenase (NADP+) / methenyltetrahydrofolate cyclohydrolase